MEVGHNLLAAHPTQTILEKMAHACVKKRGGKSFMIFVIKGELL